MSYKTARVVKYPIRGVLLSQSFIFSDIMSWIRHNYSNDRCRTFSKIVTFPRHNCVKKNYQKNLGLANEVDYISIYYGS